jgi:outer membrane protein assembly factor BamD
MLRPLGLYLSLLLAAPIMRAELVWTPATGWQEEGTNAAAPQSADSRKALDLMNRARTAEENGSPRSAIRLYNRVTRNYTKSIYAPEAFFRIAHIRLGQHAFQKSFEAYQSIVGSYPQYDRFNEVIAGQYRIASSMADGSRTRWMWGVFPGPRRRERAIGYFEAIVSNAPYSDYAPLALMRIAQLHRRYSSKVDAVYALDRLISFYPNTMLTPEAYLRMADTHFSLVDGPPYDQTSATEASSYYQDYLILFPKHTEVARAEKGLDAIKTELAESKMVIARFYDRRRHNYIAARIFYNEAITIYPGSPVAQKARERLEKLAPKIAAQEAAAAAKKSKDVPKPKKTKSFWLF